MNGKSHLITLRWKTEEQTSYEMNNEAFIDLQVKMTAVTLKNKQTLKHIITDKRQTVTGESSHL